jgi:DNA-binding NarL/FixJ family response regulator
MTTILLADDHHLVRQGLRTLLEAEPDFHIVGEAGDGLEAIRLVEQHRPEVLVLDLIMPGLNGLEVARRVRRRSPQTRIVVLSMYYNEAYVLEALEAGATAYVLKQLPVDELVHAIGEATAGRRYLSPPLSELAIAAYTAKLRSGTADLYATLTPREREVLQLVAEGYSNAEIAARLVLSPRTVERHRSNVMDKLGLHSRADLVRYAVQRGILPAE